MISARKAIHLILPSVVVVLWGISCFHSFFGSCTLFHRGMVYGLEPGEVLIGLLSGNRTVAKFQAPSLEGRRLAPLIKAKTAFLESISKFTPVRKQLRITSRYFIPLWYFLIISLVPLVYVMFKMRSEARENSNLENEPNIENYDD